MAARAADDPTPRPENVEPAPVVSERPAPFPTADAAGVREIADALQGWAGPVAVDTETTGLDPARDRVRLIQVAAGQDVALIDVFAFADPVADLRPLFAALADKEQVGHNLQFDLRFLAPFEFVPGKVFDTILASRVRHAGDRAESNGRFRHGLGDAAARELGRSLDKSEQTPTGPGRSPPHNSGTPRPTPRCCYRSQARSGKS
ncbi:3'-5' exonuclease [Gemmata obscuriglobus]|uniref:DNA polymerase I (PolI) n=1 Tax=Gemmata obscuriglobus TaxID=114 RepID=UPI00016C4061|nr:DNA polymerase I (PolI) [Gemmata obscuriglobus]QEG30379.1 3'-5' exonuclease [Gemmata obscuriglobus]VTS09703.1 dna polymerase i : DNA polymerase OS=uncultured Acidobacteria bacterium GN=HGMM_F54F02C16 PE=3 SV=1: DNA_pol_A_exo1 [Gemmata obscuriglobus UQM 2246]